VVCRVSASRSGQSLVESSLVIAAISLILLGVFQVSELFAAKEVMAYAAGRGLRARTVGFNRFMVYKTVRVGSIPAAGLLTTPAPAGGPREQGRLERPRIPLYLGADHWGDLDAILNYERWDSIEPLQPVLEPGGVWHMTVRQDYPLRIAFHRAFYDADSVTLTGESDLEDHFTLYMDDEGY